MGVWCFLISLIFGTANSTGVFVRNIEMCRSLYFCMMENAETGSRKRQSLERGRRGEWLGVLVEWDISVW